MLLALLTRSSPTLPLRAIDLLLNVTRCDECCHDWGRFSGSSETRADARTCATRSATRTTLPRALSRGGLGRKT